MRVIVPTTDDPTPMTRRPSIAILGPLLVDGSPHELRASKERAIVEVLVLRAPNAVPADELRAAIWGENPPPSASKTLQGLVSRLRRALPELAIRSMHGGYRLDIAAEDVDLPAFEAGCRDGRAALELGDADQAAARLNAALACWRGEPLADLDPDWAVGDIRRLSELHLGAVEDLIDARLAIGELGGAVADAEAAVAAEPLRERRWAQLARGLAAADRRADALRSFQRARDALRAVGLDPGADLIALERSIAVDQGASPAPLPSATITHAPGTRRVIRGCIPAQVAPIVGRDDDLKAIDADLDGGPLVTVTGPAGVGKTRLAVEVARRADVEVFFVDLASCQDDVTVLAALASAFDVGGTAGRPLVEHLAEVLADRRQLLILDNCEQALDAVASVVADLVVAGGPSRILATSRERLGVPGERVVLVVPLATPLPSDELGSNALEFDAVALFMDRLRWSDPGFVTESDTFVLAAEVCRRLDGLPLALELAASSAATIGLPRLARRLDDRFSLLTTTRSGARHRSLDVALASSWDLLDDAERLVLDRLSVFAGTFSLEAVEAVVTDETIAAADVYGILDHLVGASLVAIQRRGADRRFRLLESVRLHGGARLEALGEQDRRRLRHLDWVLDLAGAAAAGLAGPEQVRWLDALNDDQDNIDAAFTFAATHPTQAGRALHAALGLFEYWLARGHRRDVGIRWCTTFAELATDMPLAARTHALLAAGLFVANQDSSAVLRLVDTAMALTADDRGEGFAYAVAAKGWAELLMHATGTSRQLVEEAYTVIPTGPMRSWIGTYFGYESALGGAVEDGYRIARASAEELADAPDDHFFGGMLGGVADLAAAAGLTAEALDDARTSLDCGERAGCPSCISLALLSLVLVGEYAGRSDAVAATREAAALALGIDELAGVLSALDVLVGALGRAGEDELAVTVDAAVEAARASFAFARFLPGREQYRLSGLAMAEDRLDDATLTRARVAGAALTYPQLVAVALDLG